MSSSTPPPSGCLLKQGGSIVSVADSQKALDEDLAGRIRATAHGAQALCRRQSLARRFRLLWQPGHAGGEQALPRRPRRLRCSSGLWRRRRAAARGGGFRRQQVPAEAQGLATCDGNKACRDPINRAHDLRRWPSGGICPARHVRARRQRSRIRSRLLLDERRQLSPPIPTPRPTIRWPAVEPASNYRPMRRAGAGSGPRTTAISPP